MNTSSGFNHQERTVSVSKWRHLVFHPLTVLGVSLLAALLFALLVMMWFDGSIRSLLLYYFLPIGIPFVAYLFDRAQYSNEYGLVRWTIDLLVVSLSLLRAFGTIPFIVRARPFSILCTPDCAFLAYSNTGTVHHVPSNLFKVVRMARYNISRRDCIGLYCGNLLSTYR